MDWIFEEEEEERVKQNGIAIALGTVKLALPRYVINSNLRHLNNIRSIKFRNQIFSSCPKKQNKKCNNIFYEINVERNRKCNKTYNKSNLF